MLLLLLPLALLWALLARRRQETARPTARPLAAPAADRVSFHGPVILRRRGGAVSALSARCPHLGCTVARLEGEELVCACHGSRFDLDGKLREGPAGEGLRPLTVEMDPGGDALTVVLET